MLCIAYAHSAYDYARLMWIAVEKQCALPVYFLNFEEVFALIRAVNPYLSKYSTLQFKAAQICMPGYKRKQQCKNLRRPQAATQLKIKTRQGY